MSLALVLDIVLAVLLSVTIWCAVALNRRLGALRRDRSELESLAGSFTQATERAGDSVGQLAENAEHLQTRVDEARSIADDLAFLMDRGEKTADKLEKLVRVQRGVSAGVETADDEAAEKSSARRAAPGRKKAKAAKAAAGGPADDPPRADLRAARGLTEDDEFAAPPRAASRALSPQDAERELLEALRSAG